MHTRTAAISPTHRVRAHKLIAHDTIIITHTPTVSCVVQTQVTQPHTHSLRHTPFGATGTDARLLSVSAGLSSTKLSGNIPVTPLRVPSHQPSSTCKEKAKVGVGVRRCVSLLDERWLVCRQCAGRSHCPVACRSRTWQARLCVVGSLDERSKKRRW